MWSELPLRAARRSRLIIGGGSGFTLVEVMVSLLVLGVALMSLWGFHWTSRQVNTNSKREAWALRLANEKLEDYRRVLADNKTYDPSGSETITVDNIEFIRRTTTAANNATRAWSKNVTVSVRWAEQRGGQGQVVLQTIVVP